MKQADIIKISAGEGRYEVCVAAIPCGKDMSVTIIGGSEPHVGAVAVACGRLANGSALQYSAGVSSIVLPDHKDDVVAKMAAKQLADKLQGNVTVSCGIHIDNATKEELELLQDNVKEALRKMLERVR